MCINKACVHVPILECLMVNDVLEDGDIGFDTFYFVIAKRLCERVNRLLPVRARDDGLCQHRIIKGADQGMLVNADFMANLWSLRKLQSRDLPWGWIKGHRVLRIYTNLNRMTCNGDILLRNRKSLPICNTDLFHDDIDPRDLLCHWMLHLKAGVHLEEIKVLLGIDQKF